MHCLHPPCYIYGPQIVSVFLSDGNILQHVPARVSVLLLWRGFIKFLFSCLGAHGALNISRVESQYIYLQSLESVYMY